MKSTATRQMPKIQKDNKKKRTASTKNRAKRGIMSPKNLQSQTVQYCNKQNEWWKNQRTPKKNNQQSPHHLMTFTKLRRKTNKVSALKKAHGSKNSVANKTA